MAATSFSWLQLLAAGHHLLGSARQVVVGWFSDAARPTAGCFTRSFVYTGPLYYQWAILFFPTLKARESYPWIRHSPQTAAALVVMTAEMILKAVLLLTPLRLIPLLSPANRSLAGKWIEKYRFSPSTNSDDNERTSMVMVLALPWKAPWALCGAPPTHPRTISETHTRESTCSPILLRTTAPPKPRISVLGYFAILKLHISFGDIWQKSRQSHRSSQRLSGSCWCIAAPLLTFHIIEHFFMNTWTKKQRYYTSSTHMSSNCRCNLVICIFETGRNLLHILSRH